MNIKLLRKIKKHILEEPKRLYMPDWIAKQHKPEHDIYYETKTGKDGYRPYPKCGTAACIAGWAVILTNKIEEIDEGDYRWAVRDIAREQLEITLYQAERLFLPSYWPAKYQDGASGDGKKKTAQLTANRIEHFIRTGR